MAYTKPFPAATAGRGALVLLSVCLLAVTAFANGPVGAAAAAANSNKSSELNVLVEVLKALAAGAQQQQQQGSAEGQAKP